MRLTADVDVDVTYSIYMYVICDRPCAVDVYYLLYKVPCLWAHQQSAVAVCLRCVRSHVFVCVVVVLEVCRCSKKVCVCSYECVLVPPNLYIHTYIVVSDT